MKYYNNGRYKPMEIALKELGLKAVNTEKHGNKTVITVTRENRKKASDGGTKLKS
ncbi:MAG: hypothetical protein LBB72_07770 [Spirochaetaceae bacterium]|jgi:hypothetical protein|nr:hypothetical protein [Spirochaetaceae bacterium]